MKEIRNLIEDRQSWLKGQTVKKVRGSKSILRAKLKSTSQKKRLQKVERIIQESVEKPSWNHW